MPAPPPSSTANAQQAQQAQHAQQPKRDPAREAINNSREKRMHEVVASMLTTLHSEALYKEQGALLASSLASCMLYPCVLLCRALLGSDSDLAKWPGAHSCDQEIQNEAISQLLPIVYLVLLVCMSLPQALVVCPT
jgi:hypothetical protein